MRFLSTSIVAAFATLSFAAPAFADEAGPSDKYFAPDPAPTQGWTRGKALGIGITTLVTGALAVPAGGVVFVAGNLHCEDADCTKPALKGVGIALMVTGVAATAGGIVLIATAPPTAKDNKGAPTAALVARPGGASLHVTF